MLQGINVRNIYNQFLLHYLYLLLIIAPTCFSHNIWSSSGKKEVYRRLQLDMIRMIYDMIYLTAIG